MAFPTLTEVYDQTRAECGDTEVAGGQIYTNSLLLPHIQSATRTLWRGLRNLAAPRVQRTFFYTLPANTNTFHPSTALITDFSEPSGPVAQRGSLTSVAVAAATQSGSNLDITCTGAHSLTTGDTVVLEQLGGLKGANILCTVTVTSSTQLLANGVVTTGTYTSGGKVVTSSNEFNGLEWRQSIPSAVTRSSRGLSVAVYQDNYFQFLPSSDDQQIRITYWSSAQVPTSGTDQSAFNDCIDFLAKYAGSMACKAQGANDRAATLKEESVGPRFSEGIFGGELRQLMQAAVRERQNLSPYERSPRPFREQGYGLGYPL